MTKLETAKRNSMKNAEKHFNKTKNAKSREIKIGDKVILKRHERGDKFDSKFYNTIYTVFYVFFCFSMITVEDTIGNRITRNISFVMPVNKTGENKTETETERKTERKQYPKRERNYVQR